MCQTGLFHNIAVCCLVFFILMQPFCSLLLIFLSSSLLSKNLKNEIMRRKLQCLYVKFQFHGGFVALHPLMLNWGVSLCQHLHAQFWLPLCILVGLSHAVQQWKFPFLEIYVMTHNWFYTKCQVYSGYQLAYISESWFSY